MKVRVYVRRFLPPIAPRRKLCHTLLQKISWDKYQLTMSANRQQQFYGDFPKDIPILIIANINAFGVTEHSNLGKVKV